MQVLPANAGSGLKTEDWKDQGLSGTPPPKISPRRDNENPCKDHRTTEELLDPWKRSKEAECPEGCDERAQRERDRVKAER